MKNFEKGIFYEKLILKTMFEVQKGESKTVQWKINWIPGPQTIYK